MKFSIIERFPRYRYPREAAFRVETRIEQPRDAYETFDP